MMNRNKIVFSFVCCKDVKDCEVDDDAANTTPCPAASTQTETMCEGENKLEYFEIRSPVSKYFIRTSHS